MSMRTLLIILAFTTALAAGVATSARADDTAPGASQAPAAIPVAVVDFEIRNLRLAGAAVADEFAVRLEETPQVQFEPKRKVKSLTLRADGPDPAAITAIATETRAQYVIVGRLFTAGGSMFAAVKIIDTANGEMYGKAVKGPMDADVATLLRRLATDVATLVAALPPKAAAAKAVDRPMTGKVEHAILQPPSPTAPKASPSTTEKTPAPSKAAPPKTGAPTTTVKPPPR